MEIKENDYRRFSGVKMLYQTNDFNIVMTVSKVDDQGRELKILLQGYDKAYFEQINSDCQYYGSMEAALKNGDNIIRSNFCLETFKASD